MNAIYDLTKSCLTENTSSEAIDKAFKMLYKKCISIRNTIFGANNSLNFVTCCEIIFKFYNKSRIYTKII